ncbi:hypothetical protein DPMN_118523 [Dreissena polymorpha]|uniref:Uncharacterized protein n=1 Tax=Dreissena polymorpha TaxID=45954 RepID=A0A9D4GHJ6_DREPO|nr:hypothetical protein DPMN_118523 [Dreissena polymorpha]
MQSVAVRRPSQEVPPGVEEGEEVEAILIKGQRAQVWPLLKQEAVGGAEVQGAQKKQSLQTRKLLLVLIFMKFFPLLLMRHLALENSKRLCQV